ncbi:MAG TPA: hypothetical protein PLP29_04935 [Candidatus Ozemobacteraceae bacterium]|nr:hypothetical protein [Candidatus Ozemobacteraceae bacterium]
MRLRTDGYGRRGGFSLVEVMAYLFGAAVLLGLVMGIFSKLGRQTKTGSEQIHAQTVFMGLANRLEKDLAGCLEWRTDYHLGGEMSLIIVRPEGTVTYDTYPSRGEVERGAKEGTETFRFWTGARTRCDAIELDSGASRNKTVRMRLSMPLTPPVVIERSLPIHPSTTKTGNAADPAGFFPVASMP